mgnify:CR=1 FL=1
MNISTNLKAIDMIKGEILSEIAHLYRTLADYDEIGDYESVTNEIATVIAMDYIEFSDMSELKKYLKSR